MVFASLNKPEEEELAMATVKKACRGYDKPASIGDIREIVGGLNDDIVSAILETGATRAEVTEAFDWLEESRSTLSAFMRPMNERVRRVYEILDYAGNALRRS